MNDKIFARFLYVIAALFLLWWALHKRRAVVEQQAAQYINDPQLLTYAANPSKFGPSTVNGSVEISVNGYNGLNQNFMPLFGFVGMAQGETWQ